MASLIDALGVLQKIGAYETIIPWILIFAACYGILAKIKVFGDDAKAKSVNLLIAIVIAFLFIAVQGAVKFTNTFLPAALAIFLVIFLMLLIFRFMGVEEKTIVSAIVENPAGYILVIVIIVVLAGTAYSAAFPEMAMATRPELAPANLTTQQMVMLESGKIFSNPTVLALVMMFALFAVTAYLMTREAKK
jgi:hypothetical protein